MSRVVKCLQVTEPIEVEHPFGAPAYPLLPKDLLVQQPNGNFTKVAPGIAVCDIELTDEQRATLREVEVQFAGLRYRVLEEASA